jgi:PAS domain S-box-containing protein
MERVRLLYIEDDDQQRKSLASQLRSMGFKVTTAKSGQSGLRLFKSRTCDAILCDLNMPEMNGLEVLDEVRQKDQDMPFIILTAHGTVPLAVKSIKKGADHFILKPLEINEITITINRAIEKAKLEQKLKESESALRMVTENVPDVIYSLNPRGEFLSLNPSVEASLGYKPAELLGTSVFELMHPQDRQRVKDRFLQAARSGRGGIRRVQFRMLSKTGEARHFEISQRWILDNGRAVRADGIARDVTERMMLENKLKEYSRHLEKMVEDRTESLKYANRQLSALNAVSDKVNKIFDEEQLFDQVPTLLTRALDFDRAYLVFEGGGRLFVRSWCPGKSSRKAMSDFVKKVNQGAIKLPPRLRESIKKKKTIFVPDLISDRRWPKEPRFLIQAKSVVISPIKVKGKVEGLIVGSMEQRDRDMNRQDVERFEVFAKTVGLALDNIRAYQSLENKVTKRTQSLKEANEELKRKAKELDDSRIEIGMANVDLLGAQEQLEEKNVELEKLLQELSKSKEQLQTIIDSATELLFLVDNDGIVRAVNERVTDYFGLSRTEVINRSLDEFHERVKDCFEDSDKFQKLVEQLKGRCDIPGKIELSELFRRAIKVKGPEPIILSPTACCVVDKDNREIGCIWDYVNITSSSEADQRVHAIVQASPIPTIISRVEDGEVLFVNEHLASLVRHPVEELIGRHTPDFYYDAEDRKKVLEALKRDGRIDNFELRLKRTDGSIFWSIVSLVIAQIGGEGVILGGVYDISERKEAEEALRKERNFVSAVLDTAGALVVVLDTKGEIVRFNRACEQTTGYSFAEVSGKPFWNILLIPEEIDMVKGIFEKLSFGQFPSKAENYWVAKDGKRRLIAWSNTVLLDDGGKVEYVIGTGIDITEQRQAEEKIKLYREIFMNASDGIAIIDPEGHIIDRNPTHRRYSGLTDDELRGKKFSDLFREHSREIEEKVSKDGGFRGEVFWSVKGLKRYIDLSVFSIRKESGEIICYAGIGRDITERKKAEEAIASRLRYEEGLALLSRTLLTGKETEESLCQALGHLLKASNAGRVYIFENFEDAADGLCMRQTHEVCAPGVEPQIDNPILQHAPYKQGFNRWEKLLGKGESINGLVETFPETEREILESQDILSMLVIPITVEGKWYGFIGFDEVKEKREWSKEDIRTLQTASEIIGIYIEKRKFEETLRVSEEKFRSLVENANEVIYSLTPGGEFSYISPKFTDITGYAVHDWIGRPLFSLMHPDDKQESQKWFETGIRGERERRPGGYEFRLIHKDGSTRWFVTNSSTILDEKGEIMELIGVAHDITEMKKVLDDLEKAYQHLRDTQSQLVQSAKMASLGQLVAGIAHEINTPIGAVNSMQDTLFRTVEKLKDIIETQFPKEHEEQSQLKADLKIIDDSKKVINSGTERVINIVKRLRSFARLDEAELKTVDIHEGLEDTLTLIHHEIKHNITVIRNYGDVPPIACYPGRLNQVFLNILINAKHAIKGKGEITITTFTKNNRINIAIKDTGVGIAEENLKRLFDPGFTTKGVGVGTGLGLSICYQIIQDHLGEILVESEVGKGTVFTVILPLDLEKRISDDSVRSKT